MSDALLLFLALLYIVFGCIDVYVVAQLWAPTRRKPRIDALTASTIVIGCVAIGGVLGALLGFSGVWRQATGQPLVPPEVSLIALVFALGIPSAGVVNYLRQLRKWGTPHAARALHAHARGSDHTVHFHRRTSDSGGAEGPTIIMPTQDPSAGQDDH